MNVHFDPQGCQTLLLKESELYFLSLGSWTTTHIGRQRHFYYAASTAKDFKLCFIYANDDATSDFIKLVSLSMVFGLNGASARRSL